MCDQAALMLQKGNAAEAERLYVLVLAADPGHAVANHVMGVIRSRQGYRGEALAHYDRALLATPDDPGLLLNRGNALRTLERPDEAYACFERALMLRPGLAGARAGLAQIIHQRAIAAWTGQRDARTAIEGLEQLLAIDPGFEYARGELLHLKMFAADWRGLDADIAAIDAGVRAGKRMIRPFAFMAVSDQPADLKACAMIVANHMFPPHPPLYTGTPRTHEKIRIGYVSGEFREQATAYLAAGLYEQHDREKFEIIGFDSGISDFSPMRQRLEVAFDRLVPIAKQSDQEAAETILAQEIDILVNLNGYFGALRMGVFARRPAPLQVNYLGFPGTLGAPYMDYILADRIVIPPDQEKFYTEKVAWLPGCYQVNDSKRRAAPGPVRRSENGLPENAFVFCNFNAGFKLTPALFAIWMRLLAQVKDSVLWLQDSNAAFIENLRSHAERHGVAASRLIFAPRQPAERHLARLALADLFLDTLPCNAHTTASDALFMGVPLLTCRGTTFPGRVAASLLHAAGLPELVTENLEDYERLALALAHDPARLAALRQRISRSAPLFDTDAFRRGIEAAYTTMWEPARPAAAIFRGRTLEKVDRHN